MSQRTKATSQGGAERRPPLDRLLETLSAAGVDLREQGRGRWRGDCPACGKNDRLNVSEDLNGRAWIRCWNATCEEADILDTLGLTVEDLRPPESAPARRIKLTRASAIRSERPIWLWEGRVPARGMTVLAGEKGLGKSVLSNAWLAARGTRGELPGEFFGRPADVLVVTAEDAWASQVKPRLQLHDADLDRVHRVSAENELGFETTITLPTDVPAIEAELERLQAETAVCMLVLDPIGALLAEGVDSHKTAAVRRALAPLAVLAERRSVAVPYVHHLTKDETRRLLHRVSGSEAFVTAARSVLALVRDPDDPDGEQGNQRVLVHVASNWSAPAPSLAIRVEGRVQELDDGSAGSFGFLAITGESSIRLDDLQRDEKDTAAGYEDAILAELSEDWLPSSEVKASVAEAKKCTERTVERHARTLLDRGAIAREGRGFPSRGHWRLKRAAGSDTASSDSPKGDTMSLLEKPHRNAGSRAFEASSRDSSDTLSVSRNGVAADAATGGSLAPPTAASTIYVDTETGGLDPRVDRLICVGFAADDSDPVVLRHPEQREAIEDLLGLDADYVGHNLGFDMSFLARAGYSLPDCSQWHDTLITAHVAGERLPGQTRLRRLAAALIEAGKLPEDILEPEDRIKAWLQHERRAARKEGRRLPALGDAPAHLLEPYLKADVFTTRAAHVHYSAAVNGQVRALALERRVLPAIFAAELYGVPLDLDAARELRDRSETAVGDLRARLFELVGYAFNPNAARQVERALQERDLDLSAVPRTPKADMPQFTEQTLTALDDELARTLLEYRSEKKLSDYVKGLWRHAHGDRLYGSFRQVGAATGRMSSGRPNLQNIPRDDLRVRYCICAGEGKRLVGADLDSVELRLLAAYAPGGALARAFRDGADLHQQTAEALGVERDQGKTINYAVTYGAGGPRIAEILGCDVDDGWEVLERWYRAYSEVKRLKWRLEEQVRCRGYIETVGGRRHFFEEPSHRLLNFLIQGSAADLFKMSVAELHEAGVPIVLLVHDEVVAEVDEERVDEVARQLESALARGVSTRGARIHGLVAEASAHRRWSDFKQEGYTP